ncbi:DUF6576 domain-containing protein [Propionibacteriaceae bacterium G1746]
MSIYSYGSYGAPEGWFKVGRVDVTSTVFVAALGAIGVVVSAFMPQLLNVAVLDPAAIMGGEVWRFFTWPWFDRISIWSVLSLAILWYFGRDLEGQIGRNRMAWLYGGMWLVLSLVSFGIGFVLGGGALLGMGYLQLLVLLLWIAEYPRRPFFFGIPAWVIGVVLVAVQVLQLVMFRAVGGLVTLVISIVLVAVLARSQGLLTDYAWIPGRRAAGSHQKAGVGARVKQAKASREQQQRSNDAARIDELLDKIGAQGMHSLTDAERRELERLRQRRQTR